MPNPCSHCQQMDRLCRVHSSASRCAECTLHNKACDIQITDTDFSRLSKRRKDLLLKMRAARFARERALEAERLAREASSAALAKEERLIKELDLLDKCADKIVTTAESRIKEQELDEFLIGLDIPILSPTPDPDFDAFLAIPSTEGASTEAS